MSKSKRELELFESIVNSDRCQTLFLVKFSLFLFESIVNSDRCQTVNPGNIMGHCLRVLLIQIGVKPNA